tara:strand:+ start:121 stop:294 length:174 start_codon:yes stop_codon:yes gene_type:complete
MRVVIPNKKTSKIDKVLTELYLLKVALETDTKEKLAKRIDKIRAKLEKIKAIEAQEE